MIIHESLEKKILNISMWISYAAGTMNGRFSIKNTVVVGYNSEAGGRMRRWQNKQASMIIWRTPEAKTMVLIGSVRVPK